MVLSFFGLTPQYRKFIFDQIHDLVFHGGGGFKHSEVYNMPVLLRNFHIQKISEWNKKQNEQMEKAQKGNRQEIQRPKISPSDVYNFKK